MLPAPFRAEGSALPVAIPLAFERFYRANLRQVKGSRIRSQLVLKAYNEWAADHSEPTLTFSALRGLMELVGHRRIQSNGVSYGDVGFASDFPTVTDSLRVAPGGLVDPSASGRVDQSLIDRVDAALVLLLGLRRELAATDDCRDPVAAAGRALGLFDR